MRRILKGLSRILPAAPSTNYLWRDFDVTPYDRLPPNPVIYDIGSQDSRGIYSFGSPPSDARILCVDIEAGPGVDVVADAHDLHIIEDNSGDCVVAVGMLLHCQYPQKVIAEFHRILKPGGIIYIMSPFVSAHPGFPNVYYFFSTEGLETTCEIFERIDSGFNRGPASTMSYLLVNFASILFSFNSRTMFAMNYYVFSWLFFWIKYLDVFIARFESARLMYSGAYFIGRKRAAS